MGNGVDDDDYQNNDDNEKSGDSNNILGHIHIDDIIKEWKEQHNNDTSKNTLDSPDSDKENTPCRKSLFKQQSKQKQQKQKVKQQEQQSNLECCFCHGHYSKKEISNHMDEHVQLADVPQAVRLSKLLTEKASQSALQKRKVVVCSICHEPTSNYTYHWRVNHVHMTETEKQEAIKQTKKTLKYVPKSQAVIYSCPMLDCKSLSNSRKKFRQHMCRSHTKAGKITKDEENKF